MLTKRKLLKKNLESTLLLIVRFAKIENIFKKKKKKRYKNVLTKYFYTLYEFFLLTYN